ncbi:MAG TPA: tetratricopeptide repeat protein [Geobacteraceae bacterium]
MKRIARSIGAAACVALLFAGCAVSKSASKQASYHFQMGQSHLGENDITGALVEFTEAEKLDPDNYELQNYLGLVYFRKNKLEIAEKKYLKSLSLKPDFSDARNNLGVTYLELRRWDEAIYQFKLVTEDIFYQNQAAAQINLALAYSGKGDHQQALLQLRSLVGTNPRDPRVHYNLGKVYFALDKLELAIGEYRKAVDLYPDYVNAHYQLALVAMKLKDNRTATTAFREVLRIAPESEIGQLSREYLDLLK